MRTSFNFLFFFFLIILSISSIAKNIAVEDRNISDFNAIDAGGVLQIILTPGQEPKLKLEGDEKDIQNVITEVRNGTLKISQKNQKNKNQKEVKVYITYSKLDALKISGVTRVQSETPLKADDFKLSLSGASKGELKFDVQSLDSDVSGACEIRLAGNTKSHKINTSGAVKFYALDLNAEVVLIKASGASRIKISASNELEVKTSGASKVSYKGNPAKLNVNSSGAGKVKQVK